MSSFITMAADSTQEVKTAKKRKKSNSKKDKKTKKAPKKVGFVDSLDELVTGSKHSSDNNSDSCGSSDSDNDSDLDLSKDLKSIGGYIKHREEMCDQMFKSIGIKKLRSMLPEILKPFSPDELKSMCLEQLEGMSKKRIMRILDGADPETISSSGTEDESMDEDDEATEKKGSDDDTENEALATEAIATQTEAVVTEQEPADSPTNYPPEEHSRSRSPVRSRSRSASSSLSGSRSRSPSHSHSYSSESDVPSEKDTAALPPHLDPIQDETDSLLAMSGSEEGEILEYRREDMEAMQEEVAALQKKEDLEQGLVDEAPVAEGAVAEGAAAADECILESVEPSEVPPALSNTQMEILELEMRARAIKAMLEKRKSSL